VAVSTVFLGLAHFGGDGTNEYFFETMVFEGDGEDRESVDKYTRRYKTLRDAAYGHAEIMAEIVRDNLHKEEASGKERISICHRDGQI